MKIGPLFCVPPASTQTIAKLFITGATVGPIVDSLHNQCLLKYDLAPIAVPWPTSLVPADGSYLFCSSWTVPPLLGIAYVVLGYILPRLFQKLVDATTSERLNHQFKSFFDTTGSLLPTSKSTPTTASILRNRALAAVASTAVIIKISEILETHSDVTSAILSPLVSGTAEQHILVLLVACIAQWLFLDKTAAALLAASLTSIGGPLSELPFVGHGFWEYLPNAADYYPLLHVENIAGEGIFKILLGHGYHHLALSSITGPCYFAVTMDAIALGRWFDFREREPERVDDNQLTF